MKRFTLLFSGLFGIFGVITEAVESEANPEILFGMSTVLSGPSADLGQHMQRGVTAGLERTNRSGGVNGRKLHLATLDDGYEPARTGPNMRQLIEQQQVLAVIGNVGGPTAVAARLVVDEQKTLFFAAFTGVDILRSVPPDRYIINFRASYAEETGAMVDALVAGAGLKPEEIAFLTQRDASSGFVGGIAAMKRHGLRDEKSVRRFAYERNTLAVENAVADLVLLDPSPKAVIMIGSYAPCAKFIKLCRGAGLNPIFLSVSFVGADSLATALGETDAHVIVTQVVPYPLDDSLPIVRDYQTDLKTVDPSAKPGFGDLEGYIAARILTLALGKTTGAPTRETVIDALEGLGRFDLGLGEPLNLSPTEHQASHRVWPTILKKSGFVPFEWNGLKELVAPSTTDK